MEQPDAPPAFFGDLLKTYRKRAKLTQHQLASLLSVHLNTVWSWERGEHLPDTRGRVLELAKALRLSAQDTQRLLEASLLAVGPSLGVPTGRLPSHPPVRDPLLPPAPVTGLIGRDGLLAHLKARLTSGTTLALSAMQGLPGVGKTTLALALAHAPEVRSHFADGLLWAGLGQTPRVTETLARWGFLLGLAPEQAARLSSMQSWAEALRMTIGERRLLLVLDDAWQLDDVLACLVGGEGCATLITTRRPDLALQVAGVDCLAVPELSPADGLTLLERMAPQVVETEPEAVRDLVEAVGGLPLGLVLLGKHLQLHSYGGQPRRVQAALERLKHRSERLQVAQAQAPAAPHPSLPTETPLSLEASIGLSVAALDAPAQAMLQDLAVFPPKPTSFPEEAALRVADGLPATLDVLVDAGLVGSLGQGRYSLHQTIVDYASQQGEQGWAGERFVAWAADFVEAHHQDAQALEQELPLLLAAFRLAAERGFQALLVRGVMRLAPRLDEWGFFAIAEPLLIEALRAAQATGDVPGQLRLAYQLAQLAQKRGDYARAAALAEEGIQLARAHQAHDQLSALLQVSGIIARKRGAREQAEQAFNEALTLARASEDRERISALLISLGGLALNYGDAIQAASVYQEALRTARERGDQPQMATALQGLAHVALRQGKYQQAQAWLEEGLAIARRLGIRERIIGLLVNLGGVVLDQGDLGEAERLYAEGLALARQMGYQDVIGIFLVNLGQIAARSGRYQEAYAIFKEGLALAEAQGYWERHTPLLLALAETALLESDIYQAEGWLQQGLKVAQDLGQLHYLRPAMLSWGDLEVQRGQWAEAAIAFGAVASFHPHTQKSAHLGLANYGLARVAAGQGKWEEAQQYAQASLTCLESIGYHKAAEVRQWLSILPLSVADRGTTRQEQQ